ncbi:MAG: cryptochrome/photolyase family protein [Pseudomonadota bacterium]
MSDLILILGDQLSLNLSSLTAAPDAPVLMAEVADEATYVKHHKKKIAFLFSAMRHFAEDLRAAGREVRYVTLDDPENAGSLEAEAKRAIEHFGATRLIVTEPGEHRLMASMRGWAGGLGVEVDILPDDRFIASHEEFAAWAEGRKQLRMEYFYREMRRKTDLLIEGGQPAGGKWNYDAENRKPPKDDLFMPTPPEVEPEEITREVLDLVADRFGDHFGDLTPFWFGVTADHAEAALDHFIAEALPKFGDYQDAMIAGRPFMYHSLLSFYINAGLLDPLEACRRVERAYLAGDAPLNAVEGFIRQIIGWREYVRGIYWREGPEYMSRNFFDAKRKLPVQ